MEIQALLGLLRERGFTGSYSTLRRFVRRVEPKSRPVFVRRETEPGEEAQVDFGYVGKLFDPVRQTMRKAWVFVMTLGFSRHLYAEIVFDQKVETWIELHVRAFEWFGGVVRRVVLDNLRAAIVRAALHDPEVQRSYRDLAEACGFLIAPCRPGTPEHLCLVPAYVSFFRPSLLLLGILNFISFPVSLPARPGAVGREGGDAHGFRAAAVPVLPALVPG